MKSYLFRVVLEPEQDAWRAFIPELEAKGAATWGHTKGSISILLPRWSDKLCGEPRVDNARRLH
jgi:hypothetical protein